MARAVILLEAAWSEGGSKVKTPDELLISTARALQLGRSADPTRERWGGKDWAEHAVLLAAELGQPAFGAPSPAGWPDQARAWAGPAQVLRRVELAEEVGRQARGRVTDAPLWAAALLGSQFSGPLEDAVQQAPDTATAITFLLASPAFQRR